MHVDSHDDIDVCNATFDDDYAFAVGGKKSPAVINVVVGGVKLSMVVDSGASSNIIDKGTWESMKKRKVKCKSHANTTGKALYAYGSHTPLRILGTFDAAEMSLSEGPRKILKASRVRCHRRERRFIFGKGNSRKTGSFEIKSISLIGLVGDKPESKPEFRGLFSGLGKLKNTQIHLHRKENVKPVIQSVRRIPFGLRDKVEANIKELEEFDIIQHAAGPTSFLSPIIVVPKPNGDIRLCVAMRQANEAIERERFPIPTVEETLAEMNGSKVFSKLDLK